MEGMTGANLRAGMMFLGGKLCGLAGAALGYAGMAPGGGPWRAAGGCLLALAGLLLLLSVSECLAEMRRQRSRDEAEEDLVARMLREGTLAQRVADARRQDESTARA